MSGKVASLVGTACVVLACGSGAQSSSAPDAFCGGLCKAVDRCGYPSATCQADCIEQRPNLVLMSVDGAERLGACVSGFDCSTLTTDALWQPAFQSCWDTARVEIAPTSNLRSFCEAYAQAWFECGSWFSTSDCEGAFGMWSDPTLARLSDCESETCEELDACVQKVLGS